MAAISGIGSIITPLLASRIGMALAVPAVSIPHLAGTGLRFFMLRRSLDRHVLLTFGIASAAGRLVGALLQGWLAGRVLTIILGVLLMFSGFTGLAKLSV